MCGLFGFVSKSGQRPSLKTLQNIARITEARGPHAFGFAWIDGSGRLRSFKQSGRITHSLELLAMAADARFLIGHTRFATQGSPENNTNNHPHPVDGGWLVHNGMIRTYHQLVEQWGLHPVSECDSEVLGLLIEQLPGTLLERTRDAAVLAGDSNLALATLWRSPDRLIALRAGNPLALGEDRVGWYFASSIDGLPNGKHVPDWTALSWSRRAGKTTLSRSTLPHRAERVQVSPPTVTRPSRVPGATITSIVRPTQPRFHQF